MISITCCPWNHGLEPKKMLSYCGSAISSCPGSQAKVTCPECHVSHVYRLMISVIKRCLVLGALQRSPSICPMVIRILVPILLIPLFSSKVHGHILLPQNKIWKQQNDIKNHCLIRFPSDHRKIKTKKNQLILEETAIQAAGEGLSNNSRQRPKNQCGMVILTICHFYMIRMKQYFANTCMWL